MGTHGKRFLVDVGVEWTEVYDGSPAASNLRNDEHAAVETWSGVLDEFRSLLVEHLGNEEIQNVESLRSPYVRGERNGVRRERRL